MLACLMLDKVKLHQKFNQWPLHLTIVPWFIISPQHLTTFLNALSQSAGRVRPITLRAEAIDYFGPKKDKRVIRVVDTSQIRRLHSDLLKILDLSKAQLSSTSYIGENFVPHVTLKGNSKSISTTVSHELYIVSLNERNVRQVVEIVKFG